MTTNSDIKVGSNIVFQWEGGSGIVRGKVVSVKGWGVRVQINNTSFEVPVGWRDILSW
jgi:hypothetical protein